jgi:hypothetical protein
VVLKEGNTGLGLACAASFIPEDFLVWLAALRLGRRDRAAFSGRAMPACTRVPIAYAGCTAPYPTPPGRARAVQTTRIDLPCLMHKPLLRSNTPSTKARPHHKCSANVDPWPH